MVQTKKVTVRPPLSDEDNSRIAAIATRYGISKERAVAELLKRSAKLAESGEAEIIKMLREAQVDYRIVRSRAPRPRIRKNTKARIIGTGG